MNQKTKQNEEKMKRKSSLAPYLWHHYAQIPSVRSVVFLYGKKAKEKKMSEEETKLCFKIIFKLYTTSIYMKFI
jgi:hypothetical protein